MNTSSKSEQLQQAWNHRILAATLRSSGVGSVVWGIIAIVIGFMMLEGNSINAVLVLIGIGLVIEGVWLMVSPSPAGLIVDGLALWVLGVWNIIVTLMNMNAGHGSPIFAVLGCYQFYWGWKSFSRHDQFASLANFQPTADQSNEAVQMVNATLAAKPDDARFPLEFQEGQTSWKARLFDDVAVFIKAGGEEILFVDKDSVNMTEEPGSDAAGEPQSHLRLGPRSLVGTLSAQARAAFATWKPLAA